MEVPKTYNGMKLVKEYPNHVLYERTIVDTWGNKSTIRESFTYWDLGFRGKQVRDRKIRVSEHW